MVRGARGGTFTAIQRKQNALDYWASLESSGSLHAQPSRVE
jgi:hypothetical protein